MERKQPSHARWRYYILRSAETNKWHVMDRYNWECANTPIGEERKLDTLDEAKLFIERYERENGYAKE